MRGPRLLRLLGVGCLLGVLALSLLSLGSIYGGGEKQHWDELAAATAEAATLGSPVLTYPAVSGTLIDLYTPRPAGAQYFSIADWSGPPPEAGPAANPAHSLWLAYVDGVGGLAALQQQITGQGYTRILHQFYPYPLYLDLYALPDARLGQELAVNGEFQGGDVQSLGWQVPPQGAHLGPGTDGGQELTLTNEGTGEAQATTSAAIQPDHFYILGFEARAGLQAGRMRSFLICATAANGWTRIAPDEAGATVPNDGAWHPVTIAVQCPAGSTKLLLDLRNAGYGAVSFRHAHLQDMAVRK